MENVKIELRGVQVGEMLANFFGAEEYLNAGSEWSAVGEINESLIEAALAHGGIQVFITAVEGAEESPALFEALSLGAYEKNGGEYSDAGNGGETVEKESFDMAFRLCTCDGSLDMLPAIFGRDFWLDSVMDMALLYAK